MSKNLEVKKQAVSEIKDKLDRAKSLVIVEYNVRVGMKMTRQKVCFIAIQ